MVRLDSEEAVDKSSATHGHAEAREVKKTADEANKNADEAHQKIDNEHTVSNQQQDRSFKKIKKRTNGRFAALKARSEEHEHAEDALFQDLWTDVAETQRTQPAPGKRQDAQGELLNLLAELKDRQAQLEARQDELEAQLKADKAEHEAQRKADKAEFEAKLARYLADSNKKQRTTGPKMGEGY